MTHQRMLPLLLGLGLLGGCDDLESTGAFRLDAPDGTSRVWAVPDAENVGGGPAQLGAGLTSNVAQVWFALGEERSAYLFDGNLAAGIETGGYFAVPAYGFGPVVEDGGVPYDVVDTDRLSYESFRVYDSGACSINLGWETGVFPPLVPAFAPRLAAAVDRQLAQCDKPETQQFTRQGPAAIVPVFRARAGGGAGALGIDDDVIRYTAQYAAESVGGCAPTTLDVAFEFGFRPGPQGGVVGDLDPQSIYVEVVDFCIAESIIEDTVRNKLLSKLPDAVAAAVRDGTRVKPSSIGLDPVTCTTDADCVSAWPGDGHRCDDDGACELQLDVDRVNVRPEGVELVLMEFDTDPQRDLLGNGIIGAVVEAVACGPDRNDNLFVIEPTPGTLSAFSAPVAGTPATICM